MEGEEITIKGQSIINSVTRLDLFDGLFTTGYRLSSFEIVPQNIEDNVECSAKLSTLQVSSAGNVWNWDDNLEVGWAAWNIPIYSRFGQYARVDMDMSIIEDLYITIYGDPSVIGASQLVNYMVTMRKVTFPIGIGAMNMVRNQSQGPVA